jgi:hypothetical protein
MSVHTIADVRLIISEARSARNQSIIVAFTKDDAPNCLSAVGLPQLYSDQLRITKGNIDSTVIDVVHTSITGASFNGRTLQKQLDWKDWLAAEWIQLDNYDKQCLELLTTRLLTHLSSSGYGCIPSIPTRITTRK